MGMMEKLLLDERDAGPSVGPLGELIPGVRASIVIDQNFCIGQRVPHSK